MVYIELEVMKLVGWMKGTCQIWSRRNLEPRSPTARWKGDLVKFDLEACVLAARPDIRALLLLRMTEQVVVNLEGICKQRWIVFCWIFFGLEERNDFKQSRSKKRR